MSSPRTSQVPGTSTLTDHVFPLFEVSGSSYDMGYQHGAQARGLVDRYLLWIERSNGRSRDVLGRDALAFLPLMEALSPSLVEEVRGLAAGADISFEEAMLCQTRGTPPEPGVDGCSAFAVKGTATSSGQPLAGQNQDLPFEFSDLAALLRVSPSDGRPRALIFTFAGQLGYTGMNEHGVAHFTNGLPRFDWQAGLPKYPFQRVMLEQHSVAGVIDLLRQHPSLSANNHVICDGQGNVGDVEVAPQGVAVFEDDHQDWRVHTNHFVTSRFAGHMDGMLPDSCDRLDRMRRLMRERWGEITVDAMKEVLADHEGDPGAICRHGAENMHSISGYIAEPSRRVLHVRRGHGCLGSWTAYEV